jgi:hypothetical protein
MVEPRSVRIVQATHPLGGALVLLDGAPRDLEPAGQVVVEQRVFAVEFGAAADCPNEVVLPAVGGDGSDSPGGATDQTVSSRMSRFMALLRARRIYAAWSKGVSRATAGLLRDASYLLGEPPVIGAQPEE